MSTINKQITAVLEMLPFIMQYFFGLIPEDLGF